VRERDVYKYISSISGGGAKRAKRKRNTFFSTDGTPKIMTPEIFFRRLASLFFQLLMAILVIEGHF